MDYPTLKALLETNPDFSTANDQALADWANEEVIDATKTTLPNEQVLAVILTNVAEFSALADGDKQIVRDILYIGDSVPTEAGEPARDTLVSIFGGQSNTIQTLAAAITYQISRAANVGIVKTVSADHVAYARTL
jgi:hypothetical protein